MKVSYLFLLIASTLLCCSVKKNMPNIEMHYIHAIEGIKKSQPFSGLTNNSKYNVSGEILRFKAHALFFDKELKVNPIDIIIKPEESLIKEKKPYLSSLGTNKKSNIIFFFSEIRNGYFFVEVIPSNNRIKTYEDRPHMGTSLLYLFKIEQGEIELTQVKEIIYG